jgi:hypothetical protein
MGSRSGIWGRRRLLSLARLLPLCDGVDVYLLGTGFPSFWVVRMGEMRLTLGLSGWTTNDWSRGSALHLLAPPVTPARTTLERIGSTLREAGAAPLAAIARQAGCDEASAAAGLNQLAHSGQVIFDLQPGVYRWRQIMPQALGEAQIGAENPELVESRALFLGGRFEIESREAGPRDGWIGQRPRGGQAGERRRRWRRANQTRQLCLWSPPARGDPHGTLPAPVDAASGRQVRCVASVCRVRSIGGTSGVASVVERRRCGRETKGEGGPTCETFFCGVPPRMRSVRDASPGSLFVLPHAHLSA